MTPAAGAWLTVPSQPVLQGGRDVERHPLVVPVSVDEAGSDVAGGRAQDVVQLHALHRTHPGFLNEQPQLGAGEQAVIAHALPYLRDVKEHRNVSGRLHVHCRTFICAIQQEADAYLEILYTQFEIISSYMEIINELICLLLTYYYFRTKMNSV